MTRSGRYSSAEAEEVARERRRLSSEARNVAMDRLKALHPEDYRRIYNEEAEKRGIKVHVPKAERLLAELRAMGVEVEVKNR